MTILMKLDIAKFAQLFALKMAKVATCLPETARRVNRRTSGVPPGSPDTGVMRTAQGVMQAT